MNRPASIFVLLATAAATNVSAQESARVISGTPVTQQVGVPRQACATTSTGAPPQCSTQTIFENRTVGYKVVYEYAGKQYTVQLPQDPGPTLLLRVSVDPASTSNPNANASPQPAPVAQTAPDDPALYADPGAVMMVQNTVAPPPYPSYVYYDTHPGFVGYYGSPYYSGWAPSISLGFVGGYRGGYRGWHHRGGHHGRR